MSSEADQQGSVNPPEQISKNETVRIETNPQALADNEQETMGGVFERLLRYDPLSIVFTLLVFAGGVMGYVKKDSSASLIAGTLFAILLAITIYIEGARRNIYPLILCLLILEGLFMYRYCLSFVFMPSGLMSLMTALLLFYLVLYRRKATSA